MFEPQSGMRTLARSALAQEEIMTPFAQLNYPWGFKKYTYINKTYGLASQWDGISLGWSAQMRRWKLVWESDAPASTFFLTHISHYGRSAESLFGATCREQVLQHNGTLSVPLSEKEA